MGAATTVLPVGRLCQPDYMPRFNLRDVLWFVVAIAIVCAFIAAAVRDRDSFAAWAVNALGYFYGILIPAVAYIAFVVTFRIVRRTSSIRSVAGALPLATVPILIGAVGTLHGYVAWYPILASQGWSPRYSEIAHLHSICLFRLFVGVSFSLPSVLLASVSLARRSYRDTDP